MSGERPLSSRSRRILQCALAAVLLAGFVCAPLLRIDAVETTPDQNLTERIDLSGSWAHVWKDADGAEITVLTQKCRVRQGETQLSARQMVVWQSQFNGRDRVEIYLEGDVVISRPGQTDSRPSAWIELWTDAGVTVRADERQAYAGPNGAPLFDRAAKRRRENSGPKFVQTQLQLPPPGVDYRVHQLEKSQSPVRRRFGFYPRTGQPYSFGTERSTQSTPPEQIVIVSGGVKMNVESVMSDGTAGDDAVELAADSMVVWTELNSFTDLTAGGESIQAGDAPLQIYLEGNIVIRQQDSVLIADRAFYDARENRALLLDAEVRITMPGSENFLRVRANRIRQFNKDAYHAQEAWLTASIFGRPGYRVDATDVFIEPRVLNPWVHEQGGWIDPITGEIDDGEVNWLTMLNNSFVLGDVPFFYLPYLSGPAEDPHLPIHRLSFGNDSIYGTSFRSGWDIFHLTGQDAPEELTSSLLLDYFSERGPAVGFEGAYDGSDLLGIGDKYQGYFQSYFVRDRGQDNLGGRRRQLFPEDEDRGRAMFRHLHTLPGSMSVVAELGSVTDRNFIEQWFEDEFDRGKDQETKLAIEQSFSNFSWSVQGRPQVNDFEYNTEWLPKADVFLLGQPIAGTPLTYTMHASAGYGSIHTANLPTDPNDQTTAIPFYNPAMGGVFQGRHELTAPFNAGPVIVTPFVWGESAYWQEDLTGQDLSRQVGSVGVRGSLSMMKVLPYVYSDILNLDGLAHRMVFDFEYAYTDSSEDISRIAQYNEFNDNAQERFILRYPVNTFGGLTPTFPTFSGNTPAFLGPRQYAIRSGAGSLVSAPYHELVDDLQVVRLGWHHRLQTKSGHPDNRRIRDWMTLDLDASLFPQTGNHMPTGRAFDEEWGLLSARYRWMASDRTAFIADALYDTFDGGQQLWSAGILSQRTARGSLYLGLRQVKALGLDSQIATARLSYLMSDKWLATGSTSFDLAENQQRGESLTLTRIGGDFLFHFGFGYDRTKDAVQATLSFEPRFGSRSRYSERLGELLRAPQ